MPRIYIELILNFSKIIISYTFSISYNISSTKCFPKCSDLKESLKITTTKSEFHSKAEEQLRKEIAKLREQMALDQQMLTARSELINNLQKTEQENRAKLDQMYYQVSEKDTLINQVRRKGI